MAYAPGVLPVPLGGTGAIEVFGDRPTRVSFDHVICIQAVLVSVLQLLPYSRIGELSKMRGEQNVVKIAFKSVTVTGGVVVISFDAGVQGGCGSGIKQRRRS